MAKTRRQTGELGIKKEEQEDRKPTLLLKGASNTTKRRDKITKRTPYKNKNNLPAQQIKVEEDTDTKSLLKSTPKYSKLRKGRYISQEQVNQLIDYVVNHGMSVPQASRKAKMCVRSGYKYYDEYNGDPEKKIPFPRNQLLLPRRCYTQEHIDDLIRYIVDDKMTIQEASAKVTMSYDTGLKYYNKYLRDPDRNIPIAHFQQIYTQDQKNDFISYIINDKMNIKEASKKAKMNVNSGRRYYHKYFDDQSPDIPTPIHINRTKRYTQEQKKEVIGCITDDKMNIAAASRKVNIDAGVARRCYLQYLRDHNMEIPVSMKNNRYSQDKINEFIGYIVDGKMNVMAASKKAKIHYASGRVYYKKYQKKHNLDALAIKYRQDKIKEVAGYIINDKISITAASKKANISTDCGRNHYRKYLKDNNLKVPPKYTQVKIDEFIGYIVNDKMSSAAASKKANVAKTTGHRYYHRYLNNQKQ